jgi:hypothetical protein
MQMTINVPDNLPPAIVQQYIHEVESKMNLRAKSFSSSMVKKREFGQFRGKIRIADDFDDELPLDFWLGESV